MAMVTSYMKLANNKWTKQIRSSNEITKQIRSSNEIIFVNNTHKAIDKFLETCCSLSHHYTYFIAEEHWGFWIGNKEPLLFILLGSNGATFNRNRPIPPNELEAQFEYSDPKFFNKLKEVLELYEFVRINK